jgi:hypothetical protein
MAGNLTGNLIIPRVEVYWGDVNLTSYNGKGDYPQGEPLVYKVECNLPSEDENPSATMMWAPTAGAYAIYRDLLDTKADYQIVTTFGYPRPYVGAKKVSFVWIWGGNHYTYGNRMELKVELLSELSGLINSTIKSTANAPDYSISMLQAIEKTEQQYGVDKLKLIKYTDVALKDIQATKIQNNYGRDMVFARAIKSIIQENGNYVFSTNILPEATTSTTPITDSSQTASKIVIFTPYQYEGTGDTVESGQARKYDEYPDPTKRYGYLLGPSMINEMERSYKWEPPQQLNIPSALKQVQPTGRARSPRAGSRGGKRHTATETNLGTAQNSTNQTNTGSTPRGAPQGGARINRFVNFKLDPVGPKKQILRQQEAAARLELRTFLVPALVGIKPYDIIYVPSLKKDKTVNDIEDWIVTRVNYTQTDGGVEVTISGSRPYGLEGTLMNVASGQKFLAQANALKTIEDWEKYAWCIGSPESGNTTAPGPVPIPIVPYNPPGTPGTPTLANTPGPANPATPPGAPKQQPGPPLITGQSKRDVENQAKVIQFGTVKGGITLVRNGLLFMDWVSKEYPKWLFKLGPKGTGVFVNQPINVVKNAYDQYVKQYGFELLF